MTGCSTAAFSRVRHKRDRDDLGRATRQAGESRANAAIFRARAADARAEKNLGATIAEKYPELYDREVTARRAHQQAQRVKQAAQIAVRISRGRQ
ncbi:hypothetical protein ABZX30_18005 [Streptomyces sp. NPDC004542]|uniref:hypothetical protein n=1 Tax=Streptomyces sp. NPDC004542 TaxID=3154281 RepID=UPI0033B6EB96